MAKYEKRPMDVGRPDGNVCFGCVFYDPKEYFDCEDGLEEHELVDCMADNTIYVKIED